MHGLKPPKKKAQKTKINTNPKTFSRSNLSPQAKRRKKAPR